MQERRSEARMLCADMVEVCWKDAGRNCRAMALLEDISRFGACLQLEIPIPLGTEIKVSCAKSKLAGLVRYCIYREVGYFVGMEFKSSSRWSRREFEPRHLLDLRQLAAGPKK